MEKKFKGSVAAQTINEFQHDKLSFYKDKAK